MTQDNREIKRIRNWLVKRGLLHDPWVILGSAPGLTFPSMNAKTYRRIDINNSGLTARELGLGPADLTIRRAKANWAAQPDLDTKALAWLTDKAEIFLRLELLTKRRAARVGSLCGLQKSAWYEIIEAVAGPGVKDAGPWGRPTNGVAAACFGLYFGVPQIILSGFSVDTNGHSYDSLNRERKQVNEDAFVFRIFAAEPRIATSEPALAEATGIRLWTGA